MLLEAMAIATERAEEVGLVCFFVGFLLGRFVRWR
jgi:hypothetical protein